MPINQLKLLRTNRFLPLFLTQFLGAFNDNLYKNVLAILFTYTLISSFSLRPEVLLALLSGIFILPFFLFSATAGQLADKFEKSKLIRLIKLFEICLMGLTAYGFYLHSTLLLLTSLFLIGTQ